MKDFFERQELARRQTRWLVVYFILAIVLMDLAIYLVFAGVFLHDRIEPGSWSGLWDAPLLGMVSAGVLLVVLVGSLTKMSMLRQGGGAVATYLGGVLVSPNTTDPDQRRLLNVVEEMALASGTTVPEVYLLPEEKGINAFAAGNSTADAAIGVTHGCLKLLNRDELQGVIGHEFSHILNGDMRLNQRLMGLVHGILCLAIIGRVLLRSGSRHAYRLGARSRKGGNPLPLLGLGLLVIGSIGVFFGRLIKSAVSRQREFLADAAAVQFTRNPQGLATALKKIGGLAYGSRLDSPRAEEASHLFFSNGLTESWFGLMATHPPLAERIRLLDPNFNGEFPALRPLPEEPAAQPPAFKSRPSPPPLPAFVRPDTIVSRVGRPTSAHLEYAAAVRTALPEPLQEAAHEPLGALAMITGLLLSPLLPVRNRQLGQLQDSLGESMLGEIERLSPCLEKLPHEGRLPLVLLSVPALARLSAQQYTQAHQAIEQLVQTDDTIDLFEFALLKILEHRLTPRFAPARPRMVQYYSWPPLLSDCAALLSALAHHGHMDPEQIRAAFAAGARRLPPVVGLVPFVAQAECDLPAVGRALDRLAQAVPAIKKLTLEACAWTVAADAQINPHEAELLRAIADTLDCPLPPFLAGV